MSRNRTDREKRSEKSSESRIVGKKRPAASGGSPGKRGSDPQSRIVQPAAEGSYRSSETPQKDAHSLTDQEAITRLFPKAVVNVVKHDANAPRQDLREVQRDKERREDEE